MKPFHIKSFNINFKNIDDLKENSDNIFMLKALKINKTDYSMEKYLLGDLLAICFIDNGANHRMIDMNSKFKMLIPSIHHKDNENEIIEVSKDIFTEIKPSVMEWSLEKELEITFDTLKTEFFEPLYGFIKENPKSFDEWSIRFDENWIFQTTKNMRKLKIKKLYD